MTSRAPAVEIPDFLARRADLTPDRPALECLTTGVVLSYRDLNDAAARTAALLRDRGLGDAGRIAFLGRNGLEAWILLFATLKAGATLAMLNWRAPVLELEKLTADFGAQALFHGDEDEETAVDLAGRAGFPAYNVTARGAGSWAAARDACAPFERRFAPADAPWYLLYTSGTTGLPKGVIQTPLMAVVNMVNIGGAIDLREDDATLCYLPLFHSAGVHLHAMPTLMRGGRVLVAPGFEVDQVIDLIDQGRITVFLGVPTIYQAIAEHPRFPAMDLSKVRQWAAGGAALSDALARTFAERGVAICGGMGMTETGPTVFLARPEQAARKIGSVGKPQILVDAKVVRADGAEADVDEPGDLLIKGPGLTPGYWNRPDATADLHTADGWLKTGDLARKDADGDFYIVGRSKDMFISGGENVYPAEVENVLCDHPGVAEAAVVGVPDPKWGEVGHAHILPTAGGAAPNAADLAAHCRERLAAYKVPKAFAFVTDYPRTAAGKIRKHLLDPISDET